MGEEGRRSREARKQRQRWCWEGRMPSLEGFNPHPHLLHPGSQTEPAFMVCLTPRSVTLSLAMANYLAKSNIRKGFFSF